MAEYKTLMSEKYNKTDEEILKELVDNYNICQSAYSDQREEAEEDFDFYWGKQWTEEQKNQRDLEGKPTLSINYLSQFVDGIINNYKRNRHEINIKAGDNSSNTTTAEAFRAIIKDIQNKSFAENIYDTALFNSVVCGEGYFRIITDYKNEKSFEQEVFIKPIEDIFDVYIDPNFNIDYDNIDYAFVSTVMNKDVFLKKYPDSKAYTPQFDLKRHNNSWCTANTVRLVEYFYIERKKKTLVLTEDGRSYDKNSYKKDNIESPIVDEKDVEVKIVRWCLSNGLEILEKRTFPGSYIPIIPVFGKTSRYKGERMFEGVIRQAKNPQRKYNYYQCTELEVIALSPRAPWLIPEGAIEGYEQDWKRSNKANIPYLEYKTTDKQGNNVSPPSRAQFDSNISTVLSAKAGSIEDIKATTGIYDPALGKEEANGQSGVSILRRQEQSENNTLGYGDNLSKSLKLAGKILLEIIPEIYHFDREIRLEERGKEKTISLSDPEIDFKNGFYNVEVSIGPAGKTQRQEAQEAFIELAQVSPKIQDIGLDLLVRSFDWPMSDELANRLQKTLPAELQDNDNGGITPQAQEAIMQVQQQAQEQLAQMQTQNSLLQTMLTQVTSWLNKAQNTIDSKVLDNESKERIAQQDNETKIVLEGMKQNQQTKSKLLDIQQTNNQNNSQLPDKPETLIPGLNDPVTEISGQTAMEKNREQSSQNISNLTPEGLEGFNPDDLLNKIQQQLTSPKMNYR